VELGRRVRSARERLQGTDGRPLSQERLADQLGVHRTYVGQVERGEVNIALSNLLRFAEALGVDPADLVRGLRP
jgi:transcriptional regulator with XRE-family HTH domain